MNCKIVEKQAFRVLEKVGIHSTAGDENKRTIPAFWERARGDGTLALLQRIAADKSADKTRLFGICYGSEPFGSEPFGNEPTDANTFPYSIAVPYDGNDPAPDGFRVREIPAATWAVFPIVGAMPDAIQNAWQQICAEFLPTSGYRQALNMDMEAYMEGDMSSPDYRSEIWLPVAK